MTKILLFDIETAPNLAFVWGKYEQDVLEYKNEWYILSFAYKWIDEKKTHTEALVDYSTYKKDPQNDKELVNKLWNLFNEADLVIAHNGDSFDIKKVNARFLFHGLKPPAPFKSIDTKKVARKAFNLNSNKLDDIGNYLGVGRKLKTGGWELWSECLKGNRKAWKTMVEYNKQDVVLLEKVYNVLKVWHPTHPNINILGSGCDGCPVCSSMKVQKRGFSALGVNKRQRYQCQDCGKWFHGDIIKTGITVR